MKLSVLQQDLVNALLVASRMVSSRAQLPVLGNILFSAQKGALSLSATNLEMGVVLSIGAKTEKEGKITLPAKIVTEMVSNFPPGRIELEEKGGQVLFHADGISADVATLPASEFPQMPSRPAKNTLFLSKQLLNEIFTKVSFAASTDESRPQLNGIFFQNKAEALTVVATDGFRLSKMEAEPFKKGSFPDSLLVPARLFAEAAKIFTEEKGVNVAISPKEKQVLFSDEGALLVGRLIEGDYPNFERIIPNEKTLSVVVDREELLRAVKGAAVFAREALNILKIKTKEGRLAVTSESSQHGSESAEVEAKIEGASLETAFNYRYLLEYLQNSEGKEVLFETNGPLSPGVFRDPKKEKLLHLIMPVRTQD